MQPQVLFHPAVHRFWAAMVLAGASAAHACGYHDAAGVNVAMLNWAYPDALHVRTAVWMAQASGVLPPREPAPAVDPLPAQARLQELVRWRQAQSRLGVVHGRLQATFDGQPMPTVALVLIGPMLWTRFDSADGRVNMAAHAAGPGNDDLVLVSDEAVVAALTEGRITAGEARAQGLVRVYGAPRDVERLSAWLDRAFDKAENPMAGTQGSIKE